jgi:hypothetical protein
MAGDKAQQLLSGESSGARDADPDGVARPGRHSRAFGQ